VTTAEAEPRVRARGVSLGRWFRQVDPLLVVLVVAATAYYAYRYTVETSRPGMAFPKGWFGYFDQSQYLRMAHDLSHFSLPASHFLYGLGYPLAGVPFVWLGLDYDPWMIFDGLAFVFAATASFVVAGRLFGRVAAGIAGFGLAFATPLVVYCVTPWNSTVSLVALAGILLLGTSPRSAWWHPYAIGALVAWGFAARYVDVLWLGAVGVVAALHSRSRPGDWRPLVAAASTAALLAVPVFVAQWHAFGSPFTTPYSLHAGNARATHVTDDQLGAYDLGKVPRSAFGMFISPFLLGKKASGSPLLADMFWTLAAFAGAAIALFDRRYRLLVAVVLAGWFGSTVFYLSFRATGAEGIQFGTLHYFKMWWPVAAILAGGTFEWLARLRRTAR
jgi:hypothetical protein